MAIERSAKPSWLVYLGRTLAVLFLPLTGGVAFLIAVGLIADWAQRNRLFYMRTEPAILCFIPLMLAILAALIVRWTVSKKAALKVLAISTIASLSFITVSAVCETINTQPIVAAADSFRPLPGVTRVTEGNDDRFAPAPGLAPCFDIMGFGCPNIYRTWVAPSDRRLTAADLHKVLDDSGWKDVKITDCNMADQNYPRCTADGTVGDYKATVNIVEIQNWELRMYLRPLTNG